MSRSGLTLAQDKFITHEYLSEIMRTARRTYQLPAIAIMTMTAEAQLLQEVQGVRVFDRPDLATLNDYFHIGSCSKSMLSVIAAKLIEQGKITWQTKFFAVFPELEAEANPAYRDITLEDLLLGEAGIKAYTTLDVEPLPDWGPSVVNPRWAFIQYLITQPPATEQIKGRFGHVYSNASYTMASALLERVTGLDYEHLIKTVLADELGLAAHIGWPHTLDANQPWGHRITGRQVEACSPGQTDRIPYLLTPAGDLSMTPIDYATYTRLHLQGLRGGDNYISSESYRYLHFSHDGFSLGVANGFWGDRRYSGFDGSAGTFFCRSVFFPKSNFAFVIMTNAGSAEESMAAVDWLTMRIVKKRFDWWWKFWI